MRHYRMMLPLALLTAGAFAAPRVAVPPVSNPPTVDGAVSPGEWDQATRFAAFHDGTRRRLAERETWVSLAYDDERLFVLIESDDAPGEVAVLLAPEDLDEPVVLSLGRDGALSFAGGAPPGWREGYAAAASTADGRWTIELSVSLGVLGLLPLTPRASVAADFVRVWEEPYRHTSWVWRSSVDAPNASEVGRLIFDPAGPAIRVLTLGDVHAGDLAAEIEVVGVAAGEQTVSLYYDTVAGGQQTRRAGVPVTVGPGERAVLRAARALRGEDLTEQIDDVTLWVVSDGFRRMHYGSGRLPVGTWPVVRAMSADWIGGETLSATYDLSGLPMGRFGETQLAGRLLDAAGEQAASATIPVSDRQVTLRMPIAGLAPRAYELRVEVAGEEATSTQSVTIPDPTPWLGNTIGLTDRVPEPFTPLEVDGRTVRCWGREYRFGADALPQQVVSQGEALLAEAVELTVRAGGEEVTWEALEAPVGDGMQSRLSAQGRAGDLAARCEATVDYDGMIRFDLTLTPDGATSIDDLTLSIPFSPERATYLIWTDCAGTGSPADERYGALPEEGWQSEFVPFVWLGDEDRGMVFFSEGPVGWSAPDDGPPIRVIREANRVRLLVTMVGTPRRIDAPVTYTFGLQAGPVRPRPQDWRKWTARIAPIATSNEYFGVVLANLRDRPDLIARQAERGNPLLIYTFLGETATNQPEYRYFADQWTRARSPGAGKYTHANVCPASSFLDFKLHNFAAAVEEFGIDGLYYDLAWPGPCYNQSHGHGFVDEAGELQPTYPIFAYRELAKRTYQMFHQRMPRTHIMTHISGNAICLPLNAFADHTLDGEQYAHVVAGDYIGLIPLDKMRAQFTARQFGPVPHFLPELWHRGDHVTPEPTVNMCALTFLHDSLIFPAFHNGTARQQFDQAWARFGVAEGAEFLPYWANEALIAREPAGIEVSAWTRPGRALLAIANLDAEAGETRLTIDAAALGLQGEVAAEDAVSGEALILEQGRLALAIDGQSLRMILLLAGG